MIMSLEEARRILGEEGDKMTDDQLTRLIDDLDGLARAFIRSFRSGEIKLDKSIKHGQ